MSKENIGEKLRSLREESKLPLRKVAALLDIDVAILSKMERGERKLTKDIVKQLAKIYKYDTEELLVLYLSSKVINEIGKEDLALKALKVAEDAVVHQINPVNRKTAVVKLLKKFFKDDGRVSAAWLFGSIVRGDGTKQSDLDIMVELNNKKKYSFFDLIDLSFLIEQQVNCKVDLVEKGFLKNFAATTAKKDWIKIYG